MTTKPFCGCGNEGVYLVLTSPKTGKKWYRCRDCHAKYMRTQMRKVYADPEKYKKHLDTKKKYRERKKAGLVTPRTYTKRIIT